MARLRPSEARRILSEELAEAGWDAVSAFTIEQGARPGAQQLAWWHENTPANESSETIRNLAYLRAYVRIGGERLYRQARFARNMHLFINTIHTLAEAGVEMVSVTENFGEGRTKRMGQTITAMVDEQRAIDDAIYTRKSRRANARTCECSFRG